MANFSSSIGTLLPKRTSSLVLERNKVIGKSKNYFPKMIDEEPCIPMAARNMPAACIINLTIGVPTTGFFNWKLRPIKKAIHCYNSHLR